MRRIWAAVFCVTGLLGVRARLACGKVEDRTIIAKSMSHGDLCSVISSLTLNGNFPVAFEGGVASSSIRGGFAEKITSSVVRQRSNGALSERRRNGNRMGYDRLRLTPGARWICSYGASLARPTLRPAVTMVSLSLAGWILSRSKRQVRRPLDLRCLVRRSARPRRCGWQRGLMTGSRTVVE